MPPGSLWRTESQYVAGQQLAHDAGVAAGAAVVVPGHHGAGIAGAVERQHGVGGARGRDDVGRRGRHVEVVGVDLAAGTEVGRNPWAVDGQLDGARRLRPGTGCA